MKVSARKTMYFLISDPIEMNAEAWERMMENR